MKKQILAVLALSLTLASCDFEGGKTGGANPAAPNDPIIPVVIVPELPVIEPVIPKILIDGTGVWSSYASSLKFLDNGTGEFKTFITEADTSTFKFNYTSEEIAADSSMMFNRPAESYCNGDSETVGDLKVSYSKITVTDSENEESAPKSYYVSSIEGKCSDVIDMNPIHCFLAYKINDESNFSSLSVEDFSLLPVYSETQPGGCNYFD